MSDIWGIPRVLGISGISWFSSHWLGGSTSAFGNKTRIMNLFKKLFGNDRSPSKKSSRDIVYDFADVRSQLNLPILDTVMLPYPKDDIDIAFRIYTAQLEMMVKDLPSFQSELDEVRILHMRVLEFQDIDPEDRDLVREINSGSRFAKFRTREGLLSGFANKQEEDDFMIFSKIQYKYMARESAEFKTL
jgi:hypothetical protein